MPPSSRSRVPALPGGGVRLRRSRLSRRGSFLLWVVLTTLFLFLAWGFYRAVITATARDDAQAIIEQRTCQVLAESAIAEMEARVGEQVNRFGTPMFELTRVPVYPRDEAPIDLGFLLAVPEARRLLARPALDGYALEGLTSEILVQRQIDDVPYEKRGLIVFSATVSSPGLVRRSRRRVEIARWFKTTLVTLPRPFDGYGLFLMDATGLFDPDRLAAQLQRAAGGASRTRDLLRELRDRAPAWAQSRWDELVRGAFDPGVPDAVPPPVALPAGSAVYGLVRGGSPQDLAHMDLALRVEELNDGADREREAIARMSSRVTDADAGSQEACLEQAMKAREAAVDPLFALWAFQEVYRVVPPGDAVAGSELARIASKLGPDYFARRAHYRLDPLPGDGPGAVQRRFEALVRPRLNGVVWVENPENQPLEITGTLEGKMIVIAGRGGVTLCDVGATGEEAAAKGPGLLTVHARTGPVRVSGRCRASLILGPPLPGEGPLQLTIDPDARIEGSLLMATLPSGARLAGFLDRDERQLSGYTDATGQDRGFYENYFVGLSPKIHYRKVGSP